MTILISDKADLRTRNITSSKGVMIKVSIHWEDIIILIVYSGFVAV